MNQEIRARITTCLTWASVVGVFARPSISYLGCLVALVALTALYEKLAHSKAQEATMDALKVIALEARAAKEKIDKLETQVASIKMAGGFRVTGNLAGPAAGGR